MLTFGEQPRDTTVLFGVPGLSDGVQPSLAARGFSRSEVEGLPVFATGDDYRIDLGKMGNADPFGSDMAGAQRIARLDSLLVRMA
ncbi:MAG TPA: hypothetical protein VGM83_20270 [Devosiaceae bacterium]